MPIRVREVQVKVTVNNSSAEGAADAGGGADDQKTTTITECIDQILQILNDKKER